MAFLEQMKTSMPGIPREYLTQQHRAASGLVHDVPESVRLFETMANRVSENPMWSVTANVTHEPDGTLTIRVIPRT